jgi:hypothetical protein
MSMQRREFFARPPCECGSRLPSRASSSTICRRGGSCNRRTTAPRLYVADRENNRIQRFDLSGRYLGEWTHLGKPFALKISGGALWVAIMTLEPAGRGQTPRASPWMLKVDPKTGRLLGQVESPGPHSIDVSEKEELFASGCCGGSNPTGFSWLRLQGTAPGAGVSAPKNP